MGKLTMSQIAAHELRRKLLRYFPEFSRKEMKELITLAAGITFRRQGHRNFVSETVLSVIRHSKKKILAAHKEKSPITEENYFHPEKKIPEKNHEVTDWCTYIIPNETWAGKGSGGKTNFSKEISEKFSPEFSA